MLTVYLIAAIVGGTLIVLSAFGGGDGDHDVDADHDVDLHLDHDVDLHLAHDIDLDADHDVDLAPGTDVAVASGADHGGAIDGEGLWLPFLSLRFWTYFAAGFGLVGTALTWLGSLADVIVGLAAGGTGLVSGLAMAYAMRLLKAGEAHGQIKMSDYEGAEGRVRVAIAPGAPGKIRTVIRGEELDLIALPAEGETLPPGTPVMIIDMEGTVARVVRREVILND